MRKKINFFKIGSGEFFPPNISGGLLWGGVREGDIEVLENFYKKIKNIIRGTKTLEH